MWKDDFIWGRLFIRNVLIVTTLYFQPSLPGNNLVVYLFILLFMAWWAPMNSPVLTVKSLSATNYFFLFSVYSVRCFGWLLWASSTFEEEGGSGKGWRIIQKSYSYILLRVLPVKISWKVLDNIHLKSFEYTALTELILKYAKVGLFLYGLFSLTSSAIKWNRFLNWAPCKCSAWSCRISTLLGSSSLHFDEAILILRTSSTIC